jgi:hypothetical protein
MAEDDDALKFTLQDRPPNIDPMDKKSPGA